MGDRKHRPPFHKLTCAEGSVFSVTERGPLSGAGRMWKLALPFVLHAGQTAKAVSYTRTNTWRVLSGQKLLGLDNISPDTLLALGKYYLLQVRDAGMPSRLRL